MSNEPKYCKICKGKNLPNPNLAEPADSYCKPCRNEYMRLRSQRLKREAKGLLPEEPKTPTEPEAHYDYVPERWGPPRSAPMVLSPEEQEAMKRMNHQP